MHIRSIHIGAFLIVIFLGNSAGRIQAQDIPSRLTLDEAIRLAISRNPALAADKNEIAAREGDSVAAGKRLNPKVNLQSEDFPIRANPGPFFKTQGITLQFEYEIERGGQRQLRTEAARQALQTQQFAYRNQCRLLKLEVERAFSSAILAKSNLEASRSLLDQTERMISLNQVRFEQGEISALELNRTEVEKLKFQDDVYQSDLMLRNAKSALLALLNASDLSLDIDVADTLALNAQNSESELPQASLAELLRIAFEQRPDMALRLEDKKRADTDTLLQRAVRSPNITIGGGYKRNGIDNAVVFGVTAPLKIFDRNEGGIMRADADRMRTSNLIAAVRKEIELDVQQAYNATDINHRRVEYIRTQHMKKAEETSRVTYAAYNLGGATLIDYLDAQRTYRDTLRIYNQALYDERISLYELASSIGQGVE
jgi:cobalt-zinc-cadmium efflux system outer membrane protein